MKNLQLDFRDENLYFSEKKPRLRKSNALDKNLEADKRRKKEI